MRVSGIIHQQICQLKWHLLACLGLIMVLPVEEAIVNLRAGDGNFSSGLTSVAVMFGPLLAGLIACANVQGDLNEKRYIFWRSKPANVKLLISLKFFIGLVASLLIIACPVVFAILCSIIWNGEGLDSYVPLPILIAIMTYSLCFACNVVVRKTARAWLIGMLIGCFVLVLPFMLPLNLKDFMTDVMLLTFRLYLAIILVVSAAAFVFALYAAKHDWHLRTNLRGLLWAGTGLVFVLLMLFSSQIANIKVLQEKEIGSRLGLGRSSIEDIGGKLTIQGNNYVYGRSYIDINKNNIALSDLSGELDYRIANIPSVIDDYYVERYPRDGMLYKNVGNSVYSFNIHAYYPKEEKGPTHKRFFEKIYLRSYKHPDESRTPACELDLSDCLTGNINNIRLAMRMIDNRLIACVNDSCIVVDVTEPGDLKQIDKKINVIRVGHWSLRYMDPQTEFNIPIIPVEGISIEERIRLSIDLMYRFNDVDNNIYKSSIVDIHDGKIAFFSNPLGDVVRFDVTGWDNEKVYFRFSVARPFTILEGMARTYGPYDRIFVKDQKLYVKEDEQLMVFDVRSDRRIRKLGHFVRMDWNFEDIAVLEDGKILLCARLNKPSGKNLLRDREYLYLLENPE